MISLSQTLPVSRHITSLTVCLLTKVGVTEMKGNRHCFRGGWGGTPQRIDHNTRQSLVNINLWNSRQHSYPSPTSHYPHLLQCVACWRTAASALNQVNGSLSDGPSVLGRQTSPFAPPPCHLFRGGLDRTGERRGQSSQSSKEVGRYLERGVRIISQHFI